MDLAGDLKKAEQRAYSRGYAVGVRFGRYNLLAHEDTRLPSVDTLPEQASPPVTSPILGSIQEQDAYFRGYAAGVRYGRYKATSRARQSAPAVAPSDQTPALSLPVPAPAPPVARMPATSPKSGANLLLEGLARELNPAIANGRLAQWERTTQAIAELIVDRYGRQGGQKPVSPAFAAAAAFTPLPLMQTPYRKRKRQHEAGVENFG